MTNQSGPTKALSPVERFIYALHQKHRHNDAGRVADYIPELSRADPRWFGICIATRDGHVYEVGHTAQAFTMQSVSKALVYGLALEDRGEAYMLSKVGVEPSGEAFNAISLRAGSGTPRNPMINAGAIAVCGQVRQQPGRSRIERIVDYLSGCAGRALDIDEDVYRSESETGHRNRAIGWMLRNFDVIAEDPTDTLETYFQQCAVRVTCRDLALMGATLANGGRNPATGVQAVAPDCVDNILSVMASCGMYDWSGEWIYRVGLPAKSGVGGGIMAVLPGQLGIGVFSPPLDAQGNSVRGIAVCNELSSQLALHLFHEGLRPTPATRLAYDASQVRSRRRRPLAQREVLAREGKLVRVMELQGDLVFASIEPVVRRAHEEAATVTGFALDLRSVTAADGASLRLIAQLQLELHRRGCRLLVCQAGRLTVPLLSHGVDPGSLRQTVDLALENLEDLLLARAGAAAAPVASTEFAQCELFAGWDADAIALLEKYTEPLSAGAGEAIVRAGDPGDAIYFLLSGSVEVRLPSSGQAAASRIDVFSAGMSFGEMAFIDGAPRSADVVAMEPSACRVLRLGNYRLLDAEHPRLKIRLLEAIARQMSANLRRINAEAVAFKG
jgi:glutaminase